MLIAFTGEIIDQRTGNFRKGLLHLFERNRAVRVQDDARQIIVVGLATVVAARNTGSSIRSCSSKSSGTSGQSLPASKMAETYFASMIGIITQINRSVDDFR